VAFVADHRTREWIRSGVAVYTSQARVNTPMNSHVMAHVSEASRDADAEAAGGLGMEIGVLFAPAAMLEGVWR
jgi:hypothetical protein